MKRFKTWIKSFFFPPEGTPKWQRVMPYAVLGVLTLITLIGGAYGWEYTNSPEFCGTACHTMPPEYTTYLVSPHARVDCVDCHIGKGFIATRITRKAGDLKHVTAMLFHSYEFPITAHKLRPAQETCELCHFPEKFSDDSLREIERFSNDVANTPQTTFLVMNTGGGSEQLGLGRGIHWHIVNPVEYLALDVEKQDIPYIRVVEDDGSVSEYIDIEADIDPATINPEDLEVMDCVTCHNRITHLVTSPEDTVDQLMARGLISSEIPEIRLKAIEVYSQIYDTTEKGLNGIAGLEGYYETYYPEFYAENQAVLDEAIALLQEAYAASVYPEQNSDWNSHPNNVGHKETPGCFRCHDGKHLNALDEAIRLEGNLCHSIPEVAGPSDFIANIEISRGPEPSSHLNPNWIALHRDTFDPTCENCHTTENPGGTENISFCSNSACHGNVWEHAGFDAPGLRELLIDQLPPPSEAMTLPAGGALTFTDTIGLIFEFRCAECHSSAAATEGLDLTLYTSTLQGGNSGPALVPGDGENSLLVQLQNSAQGHFTQFTPQELDMVINWIDLGAPEN